MTIGTVTNPRPPLIEVVPGASFPVLKRLAAGLFGPDLGGPTAKTWPQLIDELHALRGLDDDWDGQGAVAPGVARTEGAIRWAEGFRDEGMPPATFAIAGVNGTIFFEWHVAAGYLEIEVLAPDAAEGRWVRTGTEVAEVFVLSRRS